MSEVALTDKTSHETYTVRRVLAAGAVALAGALALPHKPSEPTVEGRGAGIYYNGEKVPLTEGLSATVVGSDLFFSGKDISNFRNHHQTSELDIRFSVPPDGRPGQELQITASTTVPTRLEGPVIEPHSIYWSWYMDCPPESDSGCAVDVYRVTTKYSGHGGKFLRINPKTSIFRTQPTFGAPSFPLFIRPPSHPS